MAALLRRASDGGSYLVRASLAQTGHWIDGLGRASAPGSGLGDDEVAALTEVSDSPYGRLRHLAPIVRMSETGAFWARPSVPLDYHSPEWPPRA
jgi:hypothetical protein